MQQDRWSLSKSCCLCLRMELTLFLKYVQPSVASTINFDRPERDSIHCRETFQLFGAGSQWFLKQVLSGRRKWSLSAENGRSEPQIARRGAVCQSNAAQDAQGDFGRTAASGPRVDMAYATVVAGHST
jgi:hypothetical protein